MLFNSVEFFLLLAVVLALCRVLPFRAQNALLLVASYVFYGWWDWRFLSLLFASTVLDYLCGWRMHHTEHVHRRRLYLWCSMAGNLGMLGVFKYFNFFAESFAEVLRAVGLQPSSVTLDIVLPVGISFYTFQTMTYTLDIFRRRLAPTRNFLDFALFVSFFPQLVAGPIERAAALLPQIERPRRVTAYQIQSGLWLMLWGFFKKIAIADSVAPFVDEAFHGAGNPGWRPLLGALYLFSIQIYCDFSGYSDIARGTARLLGFELMVNFRRPYFATDIREFWHRWHISLSTFLRDYLYIPLGGNRRGRLRTDVNLMTTMLLGGLWHGANWRFVVWGGLHGIYLAVERILAQWRLLPAASPPPFRWLSAALKLLCLFHLVALTWIFFRAETIGGAFAMLTQIVTLVDPEGINSATNLLRAAFYASLLLPLDLLQERAKTEEPFPMRWPAPLAGLLAAGMIYLLLALGGEAQSFIYFQF